MAFANGDPSYGIGKTQCAAVCGKPELAADFQAVVADRPIGVKRPKERLSLIAPERLNTALARAALSFC